jgi:hypothetical protein
MIDRILDRASAIAAPPEELRQTALECRDIARARIGELSETLRAYTVREPARALSVAFGLGVFLGWIIRRR